MTPANDASTPSQRCSTTSLPARHAWPRYIHVIRGATGGDRHFRQGDKRFDCGAFQAAYRDAGGKCAWLVNNGYDKDLAETAIADGHADLVAFGKLFIANPDLVNRLRNNVDPNAHDKATVYGGGAKGYVDYTTAD